MLLSKSSHNSLKMFNKRSFRGKQFIQAPKKQAKKTTRLFCCITKVKQVYKYKIVLNLPIKLNISTTETLDKQIEYLWTD